MASPIGDHLRATSGTLTRRPGDQLTGKEESKRGVSSLSSVCADLAMAESVIPAFDPVE